MANEEIKPALDAIGFVPDSTFGTPDHYMVEKTSCFPNPVQNTLNFKNIDNVSLVVITNIAGQRVKVFENLHGQMQFPVAELSSGLYHVGIYDDHHFITLKFIKE
jgi:hypothetical protein